LHSQGTPFNNMFFVLSKLLLFLITPITWIVIFLFCSIFNRNTIRKKKFLVLAVVMLIFFSNTFIFDRFMNAWEVPAISDSRLPETGAAILLTGMGTFDITNQRLEFNDRTDRLMQVIKLYKLKKIRKIFLCGGAGTVNESDTINADALRDYLVTIGIERSDLIVEDQSNNTHENAIMIKPLLEFYNTNMDTVTHRNFHSEKYLLVSSGWHLRRATACFRKEGINVIPYSTDRYSGPVKNDIDYLLLPSSATLFNWEKLTHEWIGCIVYQIHGWI
jgi:uncharacterized SAM-binding protein YcdF (DUF218 family)